MRLAMQGLSAAMLLAAALLPTQLSAQIDDPAPYREYVASGVAKAAHDKPPEQIEREAALFQARQEGCDAGFVEACSDLGESYELGIGVEQNRPIAAILYREGCDADYGLSCYRLGRITAGAKDEEQGRFDAARLFYRACVLGSLDGCALYAHSLKTGSGVAEEKDAAIALLRDTCNRDGVLACRFLASELSGYERDQQSKGEAITILDRHCNRGDAQSCMNLIYYGPPEDAHPLQPPRAETLTLACRAGRANGCKLLADATYAGNGVEQDTDRAMQLYDKACGLDDRYCEDVRDVRDAPELTRRCDALDAEACARLGRILLRNDLPLQDYERARLALDAACRGGHANSCASAAVEWFFVADEADPAQMTHIMALLEIGCDGGALTACDELRRQLVGGGKFAPDQERANALLSHLCENGYGTTCDELDYLVSQGEDIPLPAAGEAFLPPLDEGEEPDRFASMTEEEREKAENRCATSTLTFRDREYTDTVCRPDQLVVNGRRLNPGQAPWQALIWRPERMNGRRLTAAQRVACGGSMVLEGWILTAAHCFLNKDGSPVAPGHTIRLGVHNPRADEGVTFDILEVILHRSFTRRSYAYDVALLRYDPRRGRREGDVNSIRSIAVDNQTVEQRRIAGGEAAYIYGWGLTAASNSTTTDALLGAKLLLSSEDECTGITGLRVAQICAQGARDEQACGGDSGGPLVSYTRGRPEVIGIVSAGKDCGERGEASRYTRIGAVRRWIDQQMRQRGARLPQ